MGMKAPSSRLNPILKLPFGNDSENNLPSMPVITVVVIEKLLFAGIGDTENIQPAL